MSPKSLLLVAATMALAGCTLNRTEQRRDAQVGLETFLFGGPGGAVGVADPPEPFGECYRLATRSLLLASL